MVERFYACTELHSLFRKRPASPASVMGYTAWSFDEEIDFDYHVRRAVLPRPGRVRELLRYVSLHHSALLDRNRPMWEVHIVEGLDDGRVALYTKIHHSLIDASRRCGCCNGPCPPIPTTGAGRAVGSGALSAIP